MEHPDLLDNIKEENVDIEIKQEEVSFELIEEEEEDRLIDDIKDETVINNEIKEEEDGKENTDEIYQSSNMMEIINVKVEEEIDNVWTQPTGHEANLLALIPAIETMSTRSNKKLTMGLSCQKKDETILAPLNIPAYDSTRRTTKNEQEIAISGWIVQPNEKKIDFLESSYPLLKLLEHEPDSPVDSVFHEFHSSKEKLLNSTSTQSNYNLSKFSLVPYSDSSSSDEDFHLPDPLAVVSENIVIQSNESYTLFSDFVNTPSSIEYIDFKPNVLSPEDVNIEHSKVDWKSTQENISNSETNEKYNHRRIKISTNTNTSHKRFWDKRDACFYCSKSVSKISDHLERVHSLEKEVSQFLATKKGSNDRRSFIRVLRNKGNFVHNKKVIEEKYGTIITCRRPVSVDRYENFLPCEYCLGFYKKTQLSRHTLNCSFNPAKNYKHKSRSLSVSRSACLLFAPQEISDNLKTILSSMKNDKIAMIVRNDDLIIKYGSMLSLKFRNLTHMKNDISQKMRELGRMLQSVREFDNNILNLRQCLHPKHFNIILKAVENLSSLNNSKRPNRPSLALKLGYSLQKCSKILKSEAIMLNNEIQRKESDDFISLYEMHWANTISKRASKIIELSRWNKPSLLHVAEDVKLMNVDIQEREELKGASAEDEMGSNDDDSEKEDCNQSRKDSNKMDDDNESTCKLPSKNSNTLKPIKIKAKKQKINRKVWSTDEENAVRSYFKKDIILKIVPKKIDCEDCQKIYPCLKSRSWVTIKSKINNIIRLNIRKQLAKTKNN